MQMACGARFSLVLTAIGEVWNCGLGAFGQLGHGDSRNRFRMTRVNPDHFGGNTITFIAAGHEHSMALRGADSTLFTWGDDRLGEGSLGRVTRLTQHEVPLPVAQNSFGGIAILSMSGGNYFSVVVSVDGAMWTCGTNFAAHLGFGDAIDRPFFERVGGSELFGAGGVRMTACQSERIRILTNNGRVWVAGHFLWIHGHRRAFGPFALPDSVSFQNRDVVNISCGHWHSALVKSNGQLYLWGLGDHGALGTGNGEDLSSPHSVPAALFAHARVGNNLIVDTDRASAFALGNHRRTGDGSDYTSAPTETITLMFNALRLKEPLSNVAPGFRILMGFPGTVALPVINANNTQSDDDDDENDDGEELHASEDEGSE